MFNGLEGGTRYYAVSHNLSMHLLCALTETNRPRSRSQRLFCCRKLKILARIPWRITALALSVLVVSSQAYILFLCFYECCVSASPSISFTRPLASLRHFTFEYFIRICVPAVGIGARVYGRLFLVIRVVGEKYFNVSIMDNAVVKFKTILYAV